MPSEAANELRVCREQPSEDFQRAEDERRREIARAVGSYASRGGKLGRGYQQLHYELPRSLCVVMGSRRESDNRKQLYDGALKLYALYRRDAGPPTKEGRRRVAGRTRAYYAAALGLSMKRGKNGEPNGCRTVRLWDQQLRAMGLITYGGLYDAGDGTRGKITKRRRVTWIVPWQEVRYTHFVEALNEGPADAEPSPVAAAELAERAGGDVALEGAGPAPEIQIGNLFPAEIEILVDRPNGGGNRGLGKEEEGANAPSSSLSQLPLSPSALNSEAPNGMRPAGAAIEKGVPKAQRGTATALVAAGLLSLVYRRWEGADLARIIRADLAEFPTLSPTTRPDTTRSRSRRPVAPPASERALHSGYVVPPRPMHPEGCGCLQCWTSDGCAAGTLPLQPWHGQRERCGCADCCDWRAAINAAWMRSLEARAVASCRGLLKGCLCPTCYAQLMAPDDGPDG